MNIHNKISALKTNLQRAIVGKNQVLDLVLTALFGGGHILLEDVPGVGKTTLAKALAASLDCSFARVQFTPDTLPSDLTGLSMYRPDLGTFEVQKGLVFHQILLADELNRTSPKTQSALLEAMEEKQVTIDGQTFRLDQPFFVIATENPVGAAGTYLLPDATMDRFLMKLSIGYPDREDAVTMAKLFLQGAFVENLTPVLTAAEVLEIQEAVRAVSVHPDLIAKANEIVEQTRNADGVLCGASPRALLWFLRACQSHALLAERTFVIPEDLVDMAVPVLAHRLILTTEAKMNRISVQEIIEKILRGISFDR